MSLPVTKLMTYAFLYLVTLSVVAAALMTFLIFHYSVIAAVYGTVPVLLCGALFGAYQLQRWKRQHREELAAMEPRAREAAQYADAQYGKKQLKSSFVNGMVIYVAFPALALLASPDLPAIMGKRWLTTALILLYLAGAAWWRIHRYRCRSAALSAVKPPESFAS
ncbi:MAG: hypothetical protein KGN79_15195 [Acidobacteriota bacterium]|nr:hypothetical protein [Acidobacteriota bacterium]